MSEINNAQVIKVAAVFAANQADLTDAVLNMSTKDTLILISQLCKTLTAVSTGTATVSQTKRVVQ